MRSWLTMPREPLTLSQVEAGGAATPPPTARPPLLVVHEIAARREADKRQFLRFDGFASAF